MPLCQCAAAWNKQCRAEKRCCSLVTLTDRPIITPLSRKRRGAGGEGGLGRTSPNLSEGRGRPEEICALRRKLRACQPSAGSHSLLIDTRS